MAIDRRPDRRKPWRVRSWETDGRQHSRSFTRKADANADWPRSSTTRLGAIGPTPALGWIASRLGWGSGRRRQITSGPPRRYGIECCWTATCCPGSVRSGGRRAGVSGAGPAWRLWRAADRGDGPLQGGPLRMASFRRGSGVWRPGPLAWTGCASTPTAYGGRTVDRRWGWPQGGRDPGRAFVGELHLGPLWPSVPGSRPALRDRLNRFHEAAGDAE